jgi:hypothetical protein
LAVKRLSAKKNAHQWHAHGRSFFDLRPAPELGIVAASKLREAQGVDL